MKSEIGILARINSPYVLHLHDIQKTANNFYLLTQYCNGGDLDKLRQLRGRFSEKEARYFLGQIIKGFKAINDMDVLHRDLKLANILVHFKEIDFKFVEQEEAFKEFKKTADVVGAVDVVVADLGFAKRLEEGDMTQTMCGTPLNMAPEILRGARYNHKVDVWSLGTVFYEMLTGFVPFTGTDKNDLKRNLEKGNYRLPKHIKLSLEALDFLNCCLQHDPEKRMSWDELIKHNYLDYNFNQSKPNSDDLMLSYDETTGIFSTSDNPQGQLNARNAILINTKNPLLFQKAYEKTLMRNFEDFDRQLKDHAEEQLGKVSQLEERLGKSQLMQQFDDEFFSANQDDLQDRDKPGFQEHHDQEYDKFKKQAQLPPYPNFEEQKVANLDYEKINQLAQKIKENQKSQQDIISEKPQIQEPRRKPENAFTENKK